MTVSFELNTADFPPLPFSSVTKPVYPSLLHYRLIPLPSLSRNINIRSSKSFAIATNKKPNFSVPHILQGNFLPKIIRNPSKSSIPDLACNIPIKHSYRSICKSFQTFKPVAVNVHFVSVPVCHYFHVVKLAFCHQYVSSLAKPIYLAVYTDTDTLNVCNVVKHVSSTHDTGKLFPSTHNFVSTPRHVSWLESNNIANFHLSLTNLLSSFETKFSPFSLTSNLNFPECTFSFPEISLSRIFYHISSSAKCSLFFMILFNAMLLHQPIQNMLILIFDRFYFVFY